MDISMQSDVKQEVKSEAVAATDTIGFKCSECPDILENAKKFEQHYNSWHFPINCDDCHKIVRGTRRYNRHKERKRKAQCPQCNKTYLQSYIKYHKDTCEKRIIRKLNQPNPRRRTHKKPFKCDLCTYAGDSRQKLGMHLGTHIEKKPKKLHKCDHCDYQSRKLSSVKAHRITCAAKSETIIWF